jgi:hypothetical protein
MTIDGIMGYFGVVKRSVAFDQASDQFCLVGGEHRRPTSAEIDGSACSACCALTIARTAPRPPPDVD